MVFDEKIVLIAGATGLATITGIMGYFIGKKYHKGKAESYTIVKSHISKADDPILKYICDNSLRLYQVQNELMEATAQHPLQVMMGAPEVIQLCMNLMRLIKAKKVLDIGVYTGFSALAEALIIPKDGVVVACDVTDEYAAIGKPFWKKAKVEHKINFQVQPALITLDELINQGESQTFDFAFIDADKENCWQYYERCLKLVRSGGIIALDNTLYSGKVADVQDREEGTELKRRINKKLHLDARIDLSFLSIGDGLTLAFVR